MVAMSMKLTSLSVSVYQNYVGSMNFVIYVTSNSGFMIHDQLDLYLGIYTV